MAKPTAHILVCTKERPAVAKKPSCGAVGSEEVYLRFKQQVRARGLDGRVMVTRAGCLGHCSRGVTVAIWPHNFWYSAVTPGDVDEILARSVIAAEEVERLRMPDVPWE